MTREKGFKMERERQREREREREKERLMIGKKNRTSFKKFGRASEELFIAEIEI